MYYSIVAAESGILTPETAEILYVLIEVHGDNEYWNFSEIIIE